MTFISVCLISFLAAGLTLFSGFGLGTLLMPVMVLFFPVELAVAATAVVHLANNVFKGVLLGRHADAAVLWRFGVAAVLFAFIGAWILGRLSALPVLWEYVAFGRVFVVTPVKAVVGVLILIFVMLEANPALAQARLDKKWLPWGGAISGFFGGLSGHQGALRSLFLLKAGLSKEGFIATGVMATILVDVSRLAVYGKQMAGEVSSLPWLLVGVACLAAFAGSFLGAKIIKKVTFLFVQRVVAVLLYALSLGFISGML